MTCQEYLDSRDFDSIDCIHGEISDQAQANREQLHAINVELDNLHCCRSWSNISQNYACDLCATPIDPDKVLGDDASLVDLVETCADFVIAQESFLGNSDVDQEILCRDLHADTVRRSCCECDPSLVDCDVVIPTTSSPTIAPSGASTKYAFVKVAFFVQILGTCVSYLQ